MLTIYLPDDVPVMPLIGALGDIGYAVESVESDTLHFKGEYRPSEAANTIESLVKACERQSANLAKYEAEIEQLRAEVKS